MLARFRCDAEALIGQLGARDKIGIGVSGGPDSIALLLLAHAAFPGRIAAATVDHGLRGEAKAEAEWVASVCETLDVPHEILRAPAQSAERNVQEYARILRYQLLGDWARRHGISHVAVAHHRDDVAESFLMRTMRGSGIRGLARMSARTPIPYADIWSIVLVRPLLEWSRDELAQITASHGLTPVQDPSNSDDRYDRVRVRKWLSAEPWFESDQLASVSAHLRDAEDALAWISEQAWSSRADTIEQGEITIDIGDLPREITRRLAERAILALQPSWDGNGLDGLVNRLHKGEAATLANVQAACMPRGGKAWRFGIAAPRLQSR